jgi:hypothetical protein
MVSTDALRGFILLFDAYAAALNAMALLQTLQRVWRQARGYAEWALQTLHVRVLIDDSTGESTP